ncbi:rhomboid family intramembrane serine protease [Labilibaculum sp. A4]|uniref:rhomboid family intramembrane serine protease n=1 Tax=Labilibaculum euxinus TaxID=2686357 RepID=UPI000F620AD1|nr:rhomboid family intramembrane serine protease [Labilibaculum euxinus]MDQ1771666.1 rhomboid family intramembrane serine protease [Labilibaculum euxinus]MWN77345.1 rhomboid family intramembrane serine protease [Labilibaculum euxinus]
MNDIKIKLRHIYIPYLLIAIGTISIYSTLRWLLDFKLGILNLKQMMLDYWIPIGFAIIPMIIWFRKNVRIININGKRENGYFLYQLIATITIVIPTIIAQEYLKASACELHEIVSVNEISEAKKTDCYKIEDFNVIKQYAGLYRTSRTSGRHNENLNFTNYFVVPIVDKTFDLNQTNQKFWFGFKFTNRMSNHASDSEKDRRWKEFYNESVNDFERYNYSDFKYLKVLGNSDDKDGYISAILNRQTNLDKSNVVILEPEKKAFEERFGKKLAWIFGSFGIGAFIFLLMSIIPTLNKAEFKRFLNKKPLKDDELKDILRFLIPRGEHFTTAILIDLNLIVFVLMVFSGLNIISPTPKELLELGANRRLEVLNGEYWRLFTSMFLHGGLMHIMMNLFGIGATCALIEPILGKWKTLIAYLLSGIGASLISIYWHEHTISVGASGAIFGMMGVMIALLVTKTDRGFSGLYYIILGLYGGVSLLFGLLGGIDNAAHIGGLLSGFIIGLLIILTDWKKITQANTRYS